MNRRRSFNLLKNRWPRCWFLPRKPCLISSIFKTWFIMIYSVLRRARSNRIKWYAIAKVFQRKCAWITTCSFFKFRNLSGLQCRYLRSCEVCICLKYTHNCFLLVLGFLYFDISSQPTSFLMLILCNSLDLIIFQRLKSLISDQRSWPIELTSKVTRGAKASGTSFYGHLLSAGHLY